MGHATDVSSPLYPTPSPGLGTKPHARNYPSVELRPPAPPGSCISMASWDNVAELQSCRLAPPATAYHRKLCHPHVFLGTFPSPNHSPAPSCSASPFPILVLNQDG